MTGKRIGVAGYMGAGKTTCARMLAEFGGAVINADLEAKELMEQDPGIRRKLMDAFGEDVVDSSGIQFRRLSEHVFQSRENLEQLNTIVHPPLLDYLHSRVLETQKTICVLDAALIPLWRIESWFSIRIWVDATFETRLRRLLKKSGDPEELLRRKMHIQEELLGCPSRDEWVFVNNEGDLESLRSQMLSAISSVLESSDPNSKIG